MEALAQSILASTRERSSAVGDIKAKTSRMLAGFDREHAGMAAILKSGLSADCRARAGHVGTMRQGFRRAHDRMGRDLRHELKRAAKEVASSVASLRAGFAKVHARMAKEQRTGLAADRRTRSQAVGKLINDFHVSRGEMAQELTERLGRFAQMIQSQAFGLRKGFRASLQEIRKDVQAAHQVWKNLLFAQTGMAAPASAPGLFGKYEETRRAKERAQAEAVRQRKAEEEQQAKQARAEKSDDGEKVLRTIQDRPDGISMSRITETVGLPAALVTRFVTDLVEKGKVRKNGPSRLYFPVRGKRSA
jgi:hypothetical protein